MMLVSTPVLPYASHKRNKSTSNVLAVDQVTCPVNVWDRTAATRAERVSQYYSWTAHGNVSRNSHAHEPDSVNSRLLESCDSHQSFGARFVPANAPAVNQSDLRIVLCAASQKSKQKLEHMALPLAR
jgi:hypothetical protein